MSSRHLRPPSSEVYTRPSAVPNAAYEPSFSASRQYVSMFSSNHSGSPVRHRSNAPLNRSRAVDAGVAAPGPFRSREEHPIPADHHRSRVRGFEPIAAQRPRGSLVGAGREPSGAGREDEAIARRDLVHVGIDIDRRVPGCAAIARVEDATHVHVHVDVIPPLGHRSRVGGPTPRRVPEVASLGDVERLHGFERAIGQTEEASLGRTDMDRIGHGDARGGDPVEGRDVSPLPLGGVPDLRAIDDRPELWSVADDRGHRPARVLCGPFVPALVERVQTVLALRRGSAASRHALTARKRRTDRVHLVHHGKART